MKILSQYWERHQHSGVLAVKCKCSQIILARIQEPMPEVKCPDCAASGSLEFILTQFLIDQDPTIEFDDPDLSWL